MSGSEDKFANLSAVDVCEQIGQPYKRFGNKCFTPCYNAGAHKNGDRKPSLVVYGFDKGYHCFACGENGTNSWLLRQFGVRDKSSGPVEILRTVADPEPIKLSADDEYCLRLEKVWESLPDLPQEALNLMERKGLFHDLFQDLSTVNPKMQWKWHTNQVKGWGEGIFIPYTYQGKMVTARLRRLAGDPRFLSMPRNTMWPYNLDVVQQSQRVFVTEGETDCLSLCLISETVPAVGIPGATSGNAIERLIQVASKHKTELVVVPDNDTAGQGFADKIRLAGFEASVAVDVCLLPKKYKDVNDWFVDVNESEIRFFLERWVPVRPLAIHANETTVSLPKGW